MEEAPFRALKAKQGRSVAVSLSVPVINQLFFLLRENCLLVGDFQFELSLFSEKIMASSMECAVRFLLRIPTGAASENDGSGHSLIKVG